MAATPIHVPRGCAGKAPRAWGCVLAVLVAGCDPVATGSTAALRDGPGCGNGVVEAGEACDLGFANGPAGLCRADCQAPRCGDATRDDDERCDDGNRDDGDGCRADCQRPLRSTWVRAPVGGAAPESVHGLAAAVDGGMVVVGHVDPGPGLAPRAWLASAAVDGEFRWARALPDDDAWASATGMAVAVDPTGDIWVAGYVNGPRHDDVWVTRCDPQGIPRWDYIQDFGGNRDRAVAIVVDELGAVVAGETLRDASDRDGLVVALDDQGQRRWTWRHDGPAGAIDDARALAATPDGGFVVGGGQDDLTRWWLTKLDADGLPQGASHVPGEVGAWVSAIAVDPGGDLWVTGTEVLAAPDPSDATTWATQPWLARLDAAAQPRWIRSEPPAAAVRREAFAVALRPGGGATMVGTDPIPDTVCGQRLCPGRLWLATYDGAGQRQYWAIPDEMVRGEGRAAAWAPDGALWLGGSRRLVFSEADAWLGRYAEVTRAEATP